MARRTPPDRVPKLLDVAAAAFVEHGFQRTQMDDIAEALGVSKGTVYNAVDSKESLLAAVLTHGDAPDALPAGASIEATTLEALSTSLRDRLASSIASLELATATASSSQVDAATIGDEIELVTLDLYEMLVANRTRVMVLDRCAAEVPPLAAGWYTAGRYALVDLWVEYLDQRAPLVTSTVDHDVLARTIVELVTLWAVKMPWDPSPRPYPADMAAACAAMIRDLVTGTQP